MAKARSVIDDVGVGNIAVILRHHGYDCYAVGGCVRDALMDIKPHDIDLATNARPLDVIDMITSAGWRAYDTGLKHGTITASVAGNHYEITTFRKDGKYSDGRRPDDVSFADTIEQDLERRDFTINAMAINCNTGELVDPHNGYDDITYGAIRTVGDPMDRFSEDGLRVIRAARFAAQLGFEIMPSVLDAMTRSDVHAVVAKIAIERIKDEFMKGLATRARSFISILEQTNILLMIVPELAYMRNIPQPTAHHIYDVYNHSLHAMDHMASQTRNPFLRFVALIHDIGKPATYNGNPDDPHFYDHDSVGAELAVKVCTRLKFSGDEVNIAKNMILHHLEFYNSGWTDGQIKKWINRVAIRRYDSANSGVQFPIEPQDIEPQLQLSYADLMAHGKKDDEARLVAELRTRATKLLTERAALTTRDLALNGYDLMALGFSGADVGKAQHKLLEVITEHPELNTKEHLTQILKESHSHTL